MSVSRVVAIILTFIGVTSLIIGFCLVKFIGRPMVETAEASEKWPSTEGVVQSSEVIRNQGDNGPMYSVEIIYSYSINGQKMISDQVWITTGNYSSSRRSEFQKLVIEYPAGEEVKVFYNPDDPSVAVLIPGAFTSTYIILWIGRFFMIEGAVFLLISAIFLIKSKKKDPLPNGSNSIEMTDEELKRSAGEEF